MVSSQAVVHRFQHLRKFIHPEAILASISRQGNDWIITAISRHYSLRNIFTAAKIGSSIKALVDEPDFALFGGEMRDAHVEYIGHGGKRLKMRFECEGGIAQRRKHSLFVVGRPVRD
jgi:hypothetical protein